MKYWELIMNFNLGRSSDVIRVFFDPKSICKVDLLFYSTLIFKKPAGSRNNFYLKIIISYYFGLIEG